MKYYEMTENNVICFECKHQFTKYEGLFIREGKNFLHEDFYCLDCYKKSFK